MAAKGAWYDDWRKRMDDAGYYVSEEDAARAAYDEDFANATYANKAAWVSAYNSGDQAGMDKAHADQETARRAYSYSGGAAGDEYNPFGNQSNRPSWDTTGQITAARDAAVQAVGDYGDFTDPYQEGIDTKYGALVNRQPFSYDYRADPVYQAYAKQYAREGRRASEDALAQAAAMTGGIPSSYAQTAAQQAGNYYAAQLADKIPELYQLAYSMYADEANRNMNELQAIRGLSGDAYGRWADGYNRLLQNAELQRQLWGDQYGVYRDSVGDWENDRSFDYNADQDARAWAFQEQQYADQRADAALNNALETYLNTGDASGLAALGINPSNDALMALALAKAGRTTPVGSGGGGGGSKTSTPAEPTLANGMLSADQWENMFLETQNNPVLAAQYLNQYWNYLSDYQRTQLAAHAGISQAALKGSGANGIGLDMINGFLGTSNPEIGNMLTGMYGGGDTGDRLLSEKEWKDAHDNPYDTTGASNYDTYEEYYKDYIAYLNRGKS